MAITEIVLSGKIYQDDGDAVNGATVALLETGTATQEASTTSDSNGAWSFTETSLDATYDIKISSGTSVRYILWSDEITTKGVDTASLKIRGAASADAPLYFFASAAGANADIWTVKAADGGTFTFESFASGSSVAQLTIIPNSTVASSSVVFPGILDVNGSVDWDVTDVQVDSSGDIDLVSINDAAAAIYLRENAGTSGTIKIHADQGTSVTEGAESINILSDAGGVGIRSTANLAKAVNITSDGGTTGSIAIFNDQGTSVTEGAESISLLSDAGGVGIRSTANLANAVNITVDGGSTSSITLFNDQGTSVTEGAESISLLSDAGGIGIRSTADLANAVNLTVDGGTSSTMTLFNDQGTAATEGAASIQLLSDVGGINIKSGLDGANAILLTADGGTSETIVLHADQGTSESSIQLLSDAGGVDINAATGKDVDIAGGTVNLTSSDDAASAIYLRANAGTSETIKIHADQGTGAASISAVSDVGGITLDAGLDIALSADGGNVTMDDGTTTIFDFDVDGTALTIHDDQDTGDKAVITMAQHGALSIVTTDDDAAAADFTIDADGEIVIDAADAAGAIFKIAGTAQLSVIDGSILPTTDNDIDLGSSSYQFKDAYINGTLEADAITIGGTNVVSGSLITTLGTITAGTWNGTPIATSYIAADAITGAKIADDAVDSEHYTDGSIDNAHLADDAVGADELAANAVVNASVASDAAIVVSKLALTAGDGLTLNTNDMDLDASLTTVTTLKNTSLVIGRDADNDIDFATDNTIIFRVSGADEVELVANVLEPVTSDGVALGTGSLMWSDLFLASGSVINFNNGDMTLTHSSNTLTAAGGTVATAALTTSTIVASGIIKTDDSTAATSTTDGSLQTDGGLSVAGDAIIGDDLKLLSDSAVFAMGAGSDFTITHDGTTAAVIDIGGSGGSITNVGASGNDWTATNLTHEGSLKLTVGGAAKSEQHIYPNNVQGVAQEATAISASANSSGLAIVTGMKDNDAGKAFCDLVLTNSGTSAPSVLHSFDQLGSPPARTYTTSGGNLMLAMASDTYDVNLLGFQAAPAQ